MADFLNWYKCGEYLIEQKLTHQNLLGSKK